MKYIMNNSLKKYFGHLFILLYDMLDMYKCNKLLSIITIIMKSVIIL